MTEGIYSTTRRIAFIDALKGIAILLVVLGHSFYGSVPFPPVTPYNLFFYAYAIHMPLFFFLSGYVYNFKKYDNRFMELAKTRFRSLIVPYFLFSLITGVMLSAFTGFAWSRFIPVITTEYYWFLPCLFITELVFNLLSKYTYNNKVILMGLVVLLGLSEVLIPFKDYPWITVKMALVALLFYYSGNLLRDTVTLDTVASLVVCGAGAGIFLIFGGLRFLAIHTATLSVSLYLMYCSVAMAGILALYCGCRLAYEHHYRSRVLEFFGENCITLYLLQILIITSLQRAIPSLFDGLHIYVVAVLIVLIALPLILAINRYAPFLIGRGLNRL